MRNRRIGRAVSHACAFALMLLVGVWNVAGAHATLASSDPAANSRLTASPPHIRLVFSEPVERGMAQFTIAGADGEVRKLVVSGDPHDVHAMMAPVDALPTGSYRLFWRVVSADGHPIDGSFVFYVVGEGAGASAAVAPPPAADAMPNVNAFGPVMLGAPIWSSLLRGVAVGALMALAGLLLFMVIGDNTDPQRARATQRLATTLSVGAPVLLALHALAWAANTAPEQQLTGEWITTALGTDVGRIEAVRIGLAVLALWAMAIARRPLLALVFSAAALAVSGATGHPAAIQPTLAVPMKSVHLLAAAAWLGGLIWLAFNAWRSTSSGVRDAARVSAVALASVILVTITGAVQTWLFLPTRDALLHSSYGLVVLAKIAGLLALIAFGAYHRLRLLPRLEQAPAARQALSRSVRREIGMMALVVLAGGLLAYVPPPTAAQAAMPMSMPMDHQMDEHMTGDSTHLPHDSTSHSTTEP